MLRLVNVEVKYHDVILVLRGVSLELPTGGIVCLLGANGAGKSTALKAICGLLHVEAGKVTDGFIEFEGKRIDNLRVEEIARMGILIVMEGRAIAEHLTTEENLLAGSLVLKDGNVKKNLAKAYDYFPKLNDLRHATAGYLSGGEQQMMVIGRALMGNPKVMLLDEPSMGLSPILTREVFEIVKRINETEKVSILLVEQNVKQALQIAQYGYIFENGRVVLDGISAKLSDNEDVKEFYLGFSTSGERRSYHDVKHYKRRKRWL